MPRLKLQPPPPQDEIDRFTTLVNRVWRPWLGFILLVGWTWQIVTVHIAPWVALTFWGYKMTKLEGYTDSELEWIAILTGAVWFGRTIEKIKGTP